MGYPVKDALDSIMLFFCELFPDLLERNLIASVVILFVVCARYFLKGAPKIFSYALWGIVLLRLLVPISIESPVSVVPERTEISSVVDVNEVLPDIEWEDVSHNREVRENTPPGEPMVLTGHSAEPQVYLTIIWLVGMVYLSVRSLLSYLGLREKVKVAIPFRKGVFIADDIDSPFIMGFLHPKIYLPGTLTQHEQRFIIHHEQHHIRRGDHIFKALGFLALTIHWFNPLVWLAFILASRDMEMSCDEAVIRKLGEDVRAEYSATLLNLATGHRIIAGTPLAFGEGDPKGRIRNLAKWKKPKFWVILICVALCIVLAVCLLTDPAQGIHLYEINDGRNYSDLLLQREEAKLVSYGEETRVVSTLNGLLTELSDVMVNRSPIRTRSEDRDKSHQIVLDGRTYIHFSWNYTVVWIDNGVKPTYSYLVHDPLEVRRIFQRYMRDDYKEQNFMTWEAGLDSNYYLTIGSENVASIELTGDHHSGGVVPADSSLFSYGERVWMEPLTGVEDLRGITVNALDADGRMVMFAEVPKDLTEAVNVLSFNGWLLAPEGFEMGNE